MSWNRLSIIGDTIIGIIIFLGTKIPGKILEREYEYYDDSWEGLYQAKFTLDSIFLFIFFLFICYIVWKACNDKYKLNSPKN